MELAGTDQKADIRPALECMGSSADAEAAVRASEA
jgi:hypothetical protein